MKGLVYEGGGENVPAYDVTDFAGGAWVACRRFANRLSACE